MGDPVEADSGHSWEDQRSTYDALRGRCAVSREDGTWAALRHAEVVAAATDAEVFSSRVTTRRVIPNSLDGTDHGAVGGMVGAVKTIEEELVEWIRDNHAASGSGSRDAMRQVAERFDHMIRGLLEPRRDAPITDVTGELLGDTVDGRPLTTDEIVSILRNWTAGDLGSLATSVGVLVHFLAAWPSVQREVRALVEADDHVALVAAVEEILRIDDPFVSNRRVTTRTVSLGGEEIGEGEQVLLNWTAANRDHWSSGTRIVTTRPKTPHNLVFGIGPHVCPGRALTLMELRVMLEELLARTSWIEPSPDRPAVRETPPVRGWARVPVVLR